MPDIVCLEEVESVEALRLFNERYLNNYYKYQLVIDSFDPRRIDVGVLSNFKMQSIITHMSEPMSNENQDYVFNRDCLEISFEITKNKNLTVFLNHLKSKFVSPFTPKEKNNKKLRRQML